MPFEINRVVYISIRPDIYSTSICTCSFQGFTKKYIAKLLPFNFGTGKMCIFQSDLILYILPLHSIFKNSINRIIIFKDNYLQVKYIKNKR